MIQNENLNVMFKDYKTKVGSGLLVMAVERIQ